MEKTSITVKGLQEQKLSYISIPNFFKGREGGGDAHLVLHELLDVIQGEGDGGVIIQQEGVAGGCVVVHHQLLHAAQHVVGDRLSVVAVVPVHGGDAVQLLHAQHRAEVVGDLLQRLLVLLVDHQEGHRLRSQESSPESQTAEQSRCGETQRCWLWEHS